MKKILLTLALFSLGALAFAQPFQWSENYAPNAGDGGTVEETIFGDVTTLNPVLTSSATEAAIIGLFAGPASVYRDWLGTQTFRNEEDGFNLYWASDVEEVARDQEYIITVREGWTWSDGTEMTADDAIATFTIVGDSDVESNNYACSIVEETPVEYEKLGTYQYRFRLPKPVVNAIAVNDCVTTNGLIPAHIFMPVYEAEGAEGIKALWGVDTPLSDIVSGGPYTLSEFRQGERIALERNPAFGEAVQAADGAPLPGPERWTVTFTADRNAELALVTTGEADFYYPTTLDEVRAVQQAVQRGAIQGDFYPNIGPGNFTDYIFYNFNNTNECKQELFRTPEFRQAISIMIDRQALIDAALGGLGVAGYDYNTEASAPFDASFLEPFEYNPERGVELLNSVGYTEEGPDGVLRNPQTGCRVAFDLQYNSGNNRRAQEALVISQTLASYGVRVNPREVSTEIWGDSWSGTSLPRPYNFDAQIGALVGGDVDNPSGRNVFTLASNLNGWNKSTTDVDAWEITLDRLTRRMDETLDLDQRVEIYNRRAELMREYLPLTPLISPAFHFYENMSNIWDPEEFSSTSIESPYRPGNYRQNLISAQ